MKNTAGVQVVPKSHTHIGQDFAVLIQSHTRFETDFGEMRRCRRFDKDNLGAIVGHEKVGLAVVIEIRPDGGEAQQIIRIVTPACFETSVKVPSPLL